MRRYQQSLSEYARANSEYEYKNVESAKKLFNALLCEPLVCNNDSLLADLLKKLSVCYFRLQKTDSAILLSRISVTILENNDSINKDLSAYRYLGTYYYINKEYDSALKHLYRAAKHLKTYDNYQAPGLFTSIADIYYYTGIYDSSLKYYQISNVSEASTPSMKIYNNTNIAAIHKMNGDHGSALIILDHMKNICDSIYGKRSKESCEVLMDLGSLYYNTRNYQSSLNCFLKVDTIIGKSFPDPVFESIIKSKLGMIYRKLEERIKALQSYEQAIHIIKNTQDTISTIYANIMHNTANIYKDQKAYDSALKYYRRSMKIRKKIFGENHYQITQNLLNMALVFSFQEKFDKADEMLDKALFANLYNDSITGENIQLDNILNRREMLDVILLKGDVFLKKYKSKQKLNDLIESVGYYESALHLTDHLLEDYISIKSQISLNQYLEKTYNSLLDNYGLLLAKSGNKNYADNILNTINRSKNSSLYRMIRKYKDNTDSLKYTSKKEKELLIGYHRLKLDQMISEKSSDTMLLKASNKELFKLINELDQLKRKQKKENFRYFSEICLEGIQEIIPDSTAMIDYFYNDSLMYILCITGDNFHIEKTRLESDLSSLVKEYLKNIKFFSLQDYRFNAERLYKILIHPVKKHLKDCSSLIIIPYSDLFLLPYETLLSGTSMNTSFKNSNFLIRDYNISYCYSSGLLYHQSKNPIHPGYIYSFTGFAPFSGGDTTAESILKHSNKEIQEASDLFRRHHKKAKIFTASLANKENFKKSVASSRIIHVATHGTYDLERHEPSGLLFSGYDQNTAGKGILYPNEIYAIPMKSELVVLSACNSGSGRLVKGEGLLSMARSLYFAGTKNIIVSLFKIPDKQTKEIMVCFYKDILSGKSYSKSLRNARLQLIKKETTAFPYYWGGLILLGK